jgi:sugar phosphate permease
MALILLTYWGSNMGFSGYLPLYLEDVLGWEKTTAATAMTIASGIGIIGVLPLVLFSDRIGSRKIALFLATLVVSLSIGLIPLVGNTGFWVLLVLGGLLRTGVTAIINTTVFEIKGVGGAYAGTAIGITNTLGMLGATIAPPIGNSLEGISSSLPLYFWGTLSLLALPLIIMVKETGIKAQIVPAPE